MSKSSQFNREAIERLNPHLYAGQECQRYQDAMRRQGMVMSNDGKGAWRLPEHLMSDEDLRLTERPKGESRVEVDGEVIQAQDEMGEE